MASCPPIRARALAVGAHAAGQDDLAVLCPRRPTPVGRIEAGLHLRGSGACAHEMGAGPCTGHEREADGDHRLARPGLAGQDVQPAEQLQVEVADDAEVRDVELMEHAGILAGRHRQGAAARATPHRRPAVRTSRGPAARTTRRRDAARSARGDSRP